MCSRAGAVAVEVRETSVPVDNRMQIRRYYSQLSSEFSEWSTDTEHFYTKFMSRNKDLSIKLKLTFRYVEGVQLNESYY